MVIRIVSGATPPSVMTLFEESSLHIVIGRATYSLEISLVTYISLALYVFFMKPVWRRKEEHGLADQGGGGGGAGLLCHLSAFPIK